MSASINHFLHMWRSNTLGDNLAWRTYDIPKATKRQHTRAALKAIGLSYAGEHALAQFCALYEVSRHQASDLLGAWWLWSRIEQGRLVRVPKRAGGATTLAGGLPEGPTAPGNQAQPMEPIDTFEG